jgi:hypothetical protein
MRHGVVKGPCYWVLWSLELVMRGRAGPDGFFVCAVFIGERGWTYIVDVL